MKRARWHRFLGWMVAAGTGVRALAAAWPLEDPAERARLPLYQIIPAARPEELTPAPEHADGWDFRTWTVSHGDAGARRYSALTQINRETVPRLERAWTYRSRDGEGNIQCNPIVVDGVMYAPTVGRALVALDAARGTELWRFQLETPERIGLADAPARRGLVYWRGAPGHAPRVVFACGNWVYALDPKTGMRIAEFGDGGRTPLPTGGTAAGVIWENSYIVPGLEGDIFAYDLRTGARLWKFNLIPEPGEFGAETWRGPTRDGAHCWGGVALDEARGIVFAAVGAPRGDFIGVNRLGDNLYGDCLLALDAKTGRRLWHFQNVRHDLWDLDNPAPPNLVTVVRDGRRVDAVACVTKAGNTLLLDRVTGKPLFPFRLRRAPVSKLPGEVTAAYQPDPEWPEPFSSPEFRLADVTRRTPEATAFVLRQVERANYGWFEAFEEKKPTLYRSSRGGAEWTGACVDVPTGRLYVSVNHLLSTATVFPSEERNRDPRQPASAGEKVYMQACAGCHAPNRQGVGSAPSLVGLRHRMNDGDVAALLKTGRGTMPPAVLADAERPALLDFLMRRGADAGLPPKAGEPPRYAAVGYKFVNDHEGYPGTQPPWGTLDCLDLNTGRRLWSVPLGEYAALTRQGVPKTGTENFGGPTVTAGGLVFCAGTRDKTIRAFDKDTGEELWAAELPWDGTAPPTVYEVNGRQFVAVAAAGGGKTGGPTGDAYVAFALPEP